MAISTLQERKLREVLLFIEFLGIREDKEFVEYVNERTQQVLNARSCGKKFYQLKELQTGIQTC